MDDSELAIELAREAVTRLAPEEMPLFGVTSRLYAENPAAVEAQASGDEVLGFGAEALAALTPVALSVAGFVVAQIQAVLADESQTVIRKLFRREPGGPPPLSTEQLRRVREVAVERAKRLKLPDDQAQLLADAMVGGLAVG